MKHAYLTLFLLAACGGHGHSHDDSGHGHDHGHGHDEADERPALSYTDWTEQTELFVELPALVRGQPSPCAAHVTKLAGFEAPARGRVTVTLRGAGGDEHFATEAPSVPGIFRPVAKPTAVGKVRLLVRVELDGIDVLHDLGDARVFASAAEARKAMPEEPEVGGRITFLKEQQWPIEFSTAKVTTRALRPTLNVPGRLVPRPDADVMVSAPMAGRLVSAARGFPRVGQRVVIQEQLGVLAPRLDAADIASLELAIQSGELELGHARTERARIEGLRSEGVVPEKRVQQAVHEEEEAQAALDGARRRLDQFRRVQTVAGRGQGALPLIAPLSGIVQQVLVAPGAFVEAGAHLFRVVDSTELWLEAQIAEIDALAARSVEGGTLTLDDGTTLTLAADKLMARRSMIEPRTRTLSVWFAVDNAAGTLVAGALGSVALATGKAVEALAVPRAAVLDDGGMPVVFVQVEGEAFERRIVRMGLAEGDYVAIERGVSLGEHVAVRGAYAVKLAASSGTIPAHGHAH